MLHGATNNAPITDHDLFLFKRAGMKTFKLMAGVHGERDINMLRRAGCEHFAVRLRDLLEIPKNHDGTLPSWERWADVTIEDSIWWAEHGIHDQHWGNEGNNKGKWGGRGAFDYRHYAVRAFPKIRRNIPPAVRLGLAALSHESDGNPAEWRRAYSEPLNEEERSEPWALGFEGSLLDWHTYVVVNSYFQWLRQVTRDDLGGSAAFYHRWSHGKPIQVGEWGSSDTDLQPRPDDLAIEQAMIDEYPVWLKWAQEQHYIEASYVFILGGTYHWDGFQISEHVADAMKAALTPPQQAPDRIASRDRHIAC